MLVQVIKSFFQKVSQYIYPDIPPIEKKEECEYVFPLLYFLNEVTNYHSTSIEEFWQTFSTSIFHAAVESHASMHKIIRQLILITIYVKFDYYVQLTKEDPNSTYNLSILYNILHMPELDQYFEVTAFKELGEEEQSQVLLHGTALCHQILETAGDEEVARQVHNICLMLQNQ